MANILRNFLIKSYTDRDVFASLHRYKNRSNGIGSMLLRLNSSTFSDANHRIIRRLLPFLSNLSPLFTLPPSLLLPLLSTSKSRHLGHAKEIRREEFFPRFFLFFFSLSLSLFSRSLVRGEATSEASRESQTEKQPTTRQFVPCSYNRSSLLLSIINSFSPLHCSLSIIQVGLFACNSGDAISALPRRFSPPSPRLGKG